MTLTFITELFLDRLRQLDAVSHQTACTAKDLNVLWAYIY